MAQGSKIISLTPKNQPKKAPKPPGHLKAAGKRLWSHVSATFELEDHDHVLLTALCETLDRKNQAEKDLREHGGLTFKNRYDELKPHPCVAIIRDCNVLMARLRRELALSEEEPSDRRPPRLKYGGEVMPRRKEKTRISKGVSPHDIEALRNALREGWPWRLHEDETFRQVPLDTRLQIMISHLTGIFTIACGFPSDPHPSDETVSYLRSQLAVELDEGEKRWGGLALERWRSKDLRMP